jgi:hypothetical protein
VVANSGSAGLSYDGDWRASYLLFDDVDAIPKVRRIEYDVERDMRDLSATGYPTTSGSRKSNGPVGTRIPPDWLPTDPDPGHEHQVNRASPIT